MEVGNLVAKILLHSKASMPLLRTVRKHFLFSASFFFHPEELASLKASFSTTAGHDSWFEEVYLKTQDREEAQDEGHVRGKTQLLEEYQDLTICGIACFPAFRKKSDSGRQCHYGPPA
jgi:hypothetical protein